MHEGLLYIVSMKVIIAGTRHFTDYEVLKEYCDTILANQTVIEIISGVAKGANALGEQYANEKGFPIKQFLPDWDKYGKTAGPYTK